MTNKTIYLCLSFLGVFMLLSVAIVNSYIAFFVEAPYTGGMLAASIFWTIIGWMFFYLPLNFDK